MAPRATLAAALASLCKGSQLHRIHRANLNPWFFSSGPLWRFSPCQIVGLGACYLAEQPVAGLLETFKGFQVVDEAELRTRAQFSVMLDRQLRLADCCATAAAIHTAKAKAYRVRFKTQISFYSKSQIRGNVPAAPRVRCICE